MRPEQAATVFEALPVAYRSSYHWMNVGVDPDPQHQHNPWNLLLNYFNEDDFVVVKLDIDTPHIEHDLADQLLANPRLLNMIDQFYFEHHVNQHELYGHWGATAESVEASFQYFSALRKAGVAAHFWP